MSKTIYNISTPTTATSAFTTEWNQLADMRDMTMRTLDREFPPELREFLIWLVNNDAHINAKFMAFMACKRIGVGTK